MPLSQAPSFSAFPLRSHPHLYEINTWSWLEALSAKQGRTLRLRDVLDEEWEALKRLGFDLIWLMGVWKRSPESQRIARSETTLHSKYDDALPGWTPEDILGSPYAVKGYEPDPRIGSWEDLASTRQTLHALGMKLILDFVPNHTARDHPWVETHPERYIQGTLQWSTQNPGLVFPIYSASSTQYIAHGKDPYFPPWTDTAQLNYFNPDTRIAMLEELRTIAEFCDGVRCDMAMLILNRMLAHTWGDLLQAYPTPSQEFWSEVREALPSFLLIGEVYWNLEWELQQLGFDFTYDKQFYDRLRRNDSQGIRDHLTADLVFQNKLVRFLENHDELRSATIFGLERLPAALTLMSTLPGMRLYYQGQLEGKRLFLPVQLKRTRPEMANPEIQQWYKTICSITHAQIFHEGEWTLLPVSPQGDDTFRHLVASLWHLDHELRIVVVNLSSSPAQGALAFDPICLDTPQLRSPALLHDLLSDHHIELIEQDGDKWEASLHMNPFGAHIFASSP